MEKEYIKVAEAAIFLCVSKSKLMKMCMRRQITYHKVGRLNVFKIKDLEEYLEKNRVLSACDLEKEADANMVNFKNKRNGN